MTTFDVTAQEDVVILEERLVEDRLVSSDPAAGEYRFRGSFDEVRDLDIGETVVLGGAGFGIVRAVTEDGDETVLQLDEATLGDVIDTGTMEWDYDISWADFDFEYDESAALPGAGPVVADGEFGPQLLRALPQVSTIGYASGTPTGLRYADLQSQASKKTEVSFTHQGWKFDVELEPKDDRLNFKLVGSFGIGESAAKASISGEGWISGFNYSSVLEYEGGAPTNMSTEFNGLQGEMEIKWATFRSPQEALKDIVKISAPLTLPIPIPGPFGIPMTIQMKIAGRIVPELSAIDSSSGGSWKVKYSSDQGFSVEGDGGLPQGILKSNSIDTSGDTVTAGQGPAGFAVGLEFPRFELSVAGQPAFAFIIIDMYSTSLWTPGTLLTADIPPCQFGYTKLSAVAGYELKVLGFASLKDQYTLWEEQVDKYLDGKRCTLTGD